MSGDQVKAYIYLLCAAWLQDEQATLPNDNLVLAGLARVDHHTWEQIKEPILAKFTTSENGRIYNDRMMAEALKQHNRASAAAQREHNRRTNRAQMGHKQGTDGAQT